MRYLIADDSGFLRSRLVEMLSEIEGVDIVGIDRKQGVYESVHYLAKQGYKRIAYLGSRIASRLDGFNKALNELRQEFDKVLLWVRRHMPPEEKFLYDKDKED